MAQKSKKTEEFISLTAETLGVVSYADYFTQTPLFTSLQIKNGGADAVTDLTLTVSNENGLLASSIKPIEEVPFESAVEVDLGNVLSPLYFVGLESVREEQIFVELKKDKQTLAVEKVTVTALPFDYWQGASGNAELLASFVRPKLADCARLQSEIGAQLKKWGVTSEINGYEGCDKNVVRQTAAALYACIRRYAFEREEADISRPVEAGAGVKLLAERRATPLEMALLVSACLENLGLHPVLVLGEKEITCGVWLYDNCFMDTVSDDLQRLGKYVADGINNLSCFDVNDLFSDKNVAYSTSESHFIQKLNAGGTYDKYVDIRRCRIAHLLPLPLRARSLKGYEILSEEDMSPDAAPKMLTEAKKLSLDGKQTKDKQWERRLLDLSLKNALLNFRPDKYALHILSSDVNSTFESLSSGEEFSVLEKTADVRGVLPVNEYFGVSANLSVLNELLDVELKNRRLRTYSEAKDIDDILRYLIKKGKTAEEEAGANVLYLAFGFLKWYEPNSSEAKYAPLVLCPVKITRSKGGKGFSVSFTEDEKQINNTLLEFLLREFKIDIRGLDNITSGIRISEILAMVKMEILNMKRWEVLDEVYLASFSFARFAMWNDVRKNIDKFRKNPLIRSLLDNRLEIPNHVFENKSEDDYSPAEILCPLTADSSQFAAVAEAVGGASFVRRRKTGGFVRRQKEARFDRTWRLLPRIAFGEAG